MQAAEDLVLPELAMGGPAFAEDPARGFAAARAQHPWLARWAFGYVVTDYAAMRDLFRMEGKMRTQFAAMVELMGAAGTPWGRFQQSHLTGSNGDDHRRLRDVLAFAFTPREANRHRGLMREVVAELLDAWAPRGAFDFEAFAGLFPITVMCRLIGASPSVIPELLAAMDALGLSASMDPSLLPVLQEAVGALDAFVHRLIAERRAGGAGEGGLLDVLLQAQGPDGLTERELADLLLLLLVAGYDTTKNQLTLTMHELLRRPDMYRRCAEDFDFCRKAVEESLRLHGIVSTARILSKEIVYRDVRLPKDAMVFLPVNLAARDPSAVEAPDEFQPERRPANAHLSFGQGAHICLGQFLARAQMEEGLHLIAQRIRNPTSPGPGGWRPFPGVWGLTGLPIAFEPG
jgi:cytochrome P450